MIFLEGCMFLNWRALSWISESSNHSIRLWFSCITSNMLIWLIGGGGTCCWWGYPLPPVWNNPHSKTLARTIICMLTLSQYNGFIHTDLGAVLGVQMSMNLNQCIIILYQNYVFVSSKWMTVCLSLYLWLPVCAAGFAGACLWDYHCWANRALLDKLAWQVEADQQDQGETESGLDRQTGQSSHRLHTLLIATHSPILTYWIRPSHVFL